MITRADIEKAYQESGLTGLVIDGPIEKFINMIAVAAYKHAVETAPEIGAAIRRAYERAVTETASAIAKEATDRIEHMVRTGTISTDDRPLPPLPEPDVKETPVGWDLWGVGKMESYARLARGEAAEAVAQVFGGKLYWVTAAPFLEDGTKLYALKK
jgi:hypothetical protein